MTDVGVAKGTGFQEIRRGLVSKPAISLKKSWGGYRKMALRYRIVCFILPIIMMVEWWCKAGINHGIPCSQQ